MSPLVITAVLSAAILHALWNSLIKVSGDRLVVMGVTTASASILVMPLLFLLPLPARESWPYLALSASIHSGYMLLLIKAYSHGDFSQVYPLSRGSAPLLTALLGYLLLRESLNAQEIAGLLLIVAGIFGIGFERIAGKQTASSKAMLYSLLTGFCITLYSLVDGTGARLSGNSNSFTAWMFFLDGFLVPMVAVTRRPRKMLQSSIKRVWKSGLLVAVLSSLGYWMIIWAFTQERIALVSVLRETSVLFALLISLFVLKEKLTTFRIVIVLLILAGIALLGL